MRQFAYSSKGTPFGLGYIVFDRKPRPRNEQKPGRGGGNWAIKGTVGLGNVGVSKLGVLCLGVLMVMATAVLFVWGLCGSLFFNANSHIPCTKYPETYIMHSISYTKYHVTILRHSWQLPDGGRQGPWPTWPTLRRCKGRSFRRNTSAHLERYAGMYICMHICTYVCIHACMYGWMDGWLDLWVDESTDAWMDGWMYGWRDGGTDGRMDGCAAQQTTQYNFQWMIVWRTFYLRSSMKSSCVLFFISYCILVFGCISSFHVFNLFSLHRRSSGNHLRKSLTIKLHSSLFIAKLSMERYCISSLSVSSPSASLLSHIQIMH